MHAQINRLTDKSMKYKIVFFQVARVTNFKYLLIHAKTSKVCPICALHTYNIMAVNYVLLYP